MTLHSGDIATSRCAIVREISACCGEKGVGEVVCVCVCIRRGPEFAYDTGFVSSEFT